jgi:rubrerythrin
MNTTPADTGSVARLNDLLRLDYDAVQAYTLAIRLLEGEDYRTTLRSFRGDHERHITELTELIETQEGMPIELPHESGVFKLAVQAAAGLGGDVAVLRAFRSNERQVRDKYGRLAAELAHEDPELADVLLNAAADERRHYDWVDRTLRRLGHEPGPVEDALGTVHHRTADAMEAGERVAMQGVEGARRAWKRTPALVAAGAAAVALGAGALLARSLRNR